MIKRICKPNSFLLSDKMKIYYTYSFGDSHLDNEIESYDLYESFDKVCDELDREILNYLYNISEDDDVDFVKPNREEKLKGLDEEDYIHYYEVYQDGVAFRIKKMRVAD